MLLRHLHHGGVRDVGEHVVLAVLAVGPLAAVALGAAVCEPALGRGPALGPVLCFI